jgi:dTDP-4-dehydrorhamnose 3,5-epimerase
VTKPYRIHGKRVFDERGVVSFANDFDFEGVKRFYTVSNHAPRFIRAWHGHLVEAKYVTVLQGAALIATVKLDTVVQPSRSVVAERWALTSPDLLYIPPGYANGAMTLTPDTILMYFSNLTIEEARHDDHRWPYDYWDCWEIEQR